jgi:hypothetical protein
VLVLAFVLLARPPVHGVVLVAVSPLLAGALILTRYDLWPAAFVAAGVAALVADRHRLGWLGLACAFTAKLSGRASGARSRDRSRSRAWRRRS